MDNEQVEVPTEEDEDDDNAPEQTLLRDPGDLNPALFDPVWIHGEPFQGEIPEDIQEYLDGNPSMYCTCPPVSSNCNLSEND